RFESIIHSSLNASLDEEGAMAVLIHVVQSGESLWQITNYYHVSAIVVAAINGLSDPNRLVIGQALVVPIPEVPPYAGPKPTLEVNAYTYQSDSVDALTILQLGYLLTSVIPFAYHVTANGTLDLLEDQARLSAAFAQNVLPTMAINNFSATESGSDLLHRVLNTPEYRENLLSDIVRIMQEKGYRGLNVDFENVLPADREQYNQFLKQAADRLHPLGFLLSTAVMPKTGATQPFASYEAYDYEAHGRIVDFVVLMTYEWGFRLGPPQAISPVDKMREVVQYALSVIPANKISLGFETYARDWLLPHVEGQEAETFSPKEAVDRAIKYGAAIQYDQQAQSPYYRYVDEQGRSHEVWFEDARSAQAKFDLVKEFKLRGLSYWALGYPYPQNWALLGNNFTVRKWRS
ncbi:MAG: spore gernimation protein, partial [Sporolactobacillus laevolacticus]|nr:spore gernimation protein [Sporolactobacillus laevolacticus]